MRLAGAVCVILGLSLGAARADSPTPIVRFGVEADHPPYEISRDTGPAGFTVELIQALGEVMGFRPDIQPAPWGALRRDFVEGRLDVLAGVVYGEERALAMTLSTPHDWVRPALVARGAPPESLERLDSLEVVVVAGDPAYGLLRRAAPGARAVMVADPAEALRALAAGRHNVALLGDADQAAWLVSSLGLSHLRTRALDTALRAAAFGVAPERAELASRLDTGLAILRASGRYQAMRARWFGAPPEAAGGSRLGLVLGLVAVLAVLVAGWGLARRRIVARGPRSRPGRRDLLDGLPVGVYRTTPEGRFLEVNPALVDILGFADREALMASTTAMLYVDPEARLRWLECAADGDLVRDFEFEGRRADGGHIWLSNTALAVRDADGRVIAYQGYLEDVTERRSAREALKRQYGAELEVGAARVAASERLFKEIFKSAGDAILLLEEGGIFDCNARALELFAYSDRKDLIGRHPAILSPPTQPGGQPSPEAADAWIAEAWRNGTARFEWLHCRHTGEAFPAEVLLSAFDLNGRKVLQATIRDITARKRTEAALHESQRRMADIINLLPDPTVVIDRDGRVQFWNRAMEDMTGVRAEAILGRGDYEYALPFYGERRPILIDIVRLPEHEIENKYRNVERVNGTLVGESYVPHLRGGGIYVLGTAAPLYDSAGEYVGAIEIVRDVTARRRAEAALEDSERRLGHIIDFLPDATMVIDLHGKIITWNKAMADLTGVPSERMLGRGGFENALPFYGKCRPMLIDLVLRPDPEFEATYDVLERRGDGLYGEIYAPALRGVYIMGTASVLRDAKGLAVGAIEIVRDLSERKRMEEAMREARDAAESATRAKSEFLANMSHEIRTPMNAIIGMTSLLLNTGLTDEQRELTETTRMSGDALLALINDILDFSKIEAGRMDMEVQPFDLRQCLESAVDLVAVKADEKRLELGCLIEDGVPPTLMGDVTRLRQILVNLLNNAIKFTENGEVVTRVVAEEITDSGADFSDWATVRFSVRDTGIGIPPDRMDRLFKSFSQVDASTTRRYGGTGLGLAISSRLAELMGGRMWVESAGVPGRGSTFHFTIRVPTALEPLEQLPPESLPELAGKRVMIVDDNPTNGLILTRQTEGWGMRPETFDSPHEALETIRRGVTFDLAILDMQMPDMDGIQLGRGIREVPGADGMPLIMLTSLGRRDPGVDEVGFAGFLNKPIKSAALHDALRHALGGRRGPVGRPRRANTVEIDGALGVRHPLRVLVAEDYAINQKVALYTLGKMGYRADLASNGIEALEALRRQPYDVVLMDVQMPEMDGLQATAAIIAEWGAARPRVVAMTANAMQGDRELCLAAGMDDYVSKPVQVAELQAALLRCPSSGTRAAALAPAVDRATLIEFFPDLDGGDDTVFREMAEMLLEDVPRRLDELARAVSEADAPAARAVLHTLKGASRSFGALRFAELCQELETGAKTGALPDGAAATVDALRAEFVRVALALAAEPIPPGFPS